MFDSLFPSHWSDLQKLMWLKILKGGSAVWETISGNPVSFTAKAAPLRKLQIAFSPVQDLNGYDSPWPAGGGANIWDEEWEEGALTWAGDNYPATNKIRSKGYIPVTPETNYYAVTPTNLQIFYYDANKTCVRYAPSSLSGTFSVPADCYYMRFYTYATDSYPPPYKNDIAINYPSSVTTYSPYSNLCPISGWDSLTVYHSGADTSDPQTISISLGETVYSGWVDAVTGVGEVTHIKQAITSVSGVWGSRTNGFAVYVSISGTGHFSPSEELVSNIFTYSVAGANTMPLYSYGGSVGAAETQTFILPDTVTSAAEANAWFAANPTECMFALATPIPIQLTPQEINSLAGENVMWTDAASLEVTYRSN